MLQTKTQALTAKIKSIARTKGKLTLSEYMDLCLYDQEYGYYTTKEPFGTNGDFITAPEISQVFGELLGLWAVDTWLRMKQPNPILLIELGPGRGFLISDAIRAAKQAMPSFMEAAKIHLVETSQRLQAQQKETLKRTGIKSISWHKAIESIPRGPSIIIGNEFFDALPIRQYTLKARGWHEKIIYLDGCHLKFGYDTKALHLPNDTDSALMEKSTFLEISELANTIMKKLATRVVNHRGALLIIDYGYTSPQTHSSLQAVIQHNYIDPLAYPGLSDLTAHVNFRSLSQLAQRAGAKSFPILTQQVFLSAIGIIERTKALCEKASQQDAQSILSATDRLINPTAMGTLFKVLAVSNKEQSLTPWADN